jgi:hypothetical protein
MCPYQIPLNKFEVQKIEFMDAGCAAVHTKFSNGPSKDG